MPPDSAPRSPSGRKPLIAGNWKMHLTHFEAIALTQKIAFSLNEALLSAVDVIVLPPFTSLRSVQTLVDGDRLHLGYGGQDLSPHDFGAYTGDISGAMLAKLGCSYVVVGHSERRQYHGEDDALVHSKVLAALRHGLTPILCVGEPLQIRDDGTYMEHCLGQLEAAVAGVSADQITSVLIAYEPIWAIGTGHVATPQDAQQMCAAVRSRLGQLHGQRMAEVVRVLYGGSVKAANAGDLFAQPDIDGALVGGASLDAAEFAAICVSANPTNARGAATTAARG